jgi:ribonuclease P protein component
LTASLEISKETRSDTFKEPRYEKNIPAEPHQAQKNARLPRAHEHPERPGRSPAQTRQRAEKISCLSFSPEHRLRRRADFLLCYDTGRRHYTKQFVVFLRKREDTGAWRLGLAVTRKTGCAVVRNRIKRVLREIFRLRQAALVPGYDLVVTPKRTLQPKLMTLAVAEQEFGPLFTSLSRG